MITLKKKNNNLAVICEYGLYPLLAKQIEYSLEPPPTRAHVRFTSKFEIPGSYSITSYEIM